MTVDLIVVGSGDAARSVAYPSREAGWSVTFVDSDPFGGTCDLRGCDAKKVLVGVSEVVDWTRRMMGKGVSSPVPTLVWPDMIRFKHTFVDAVPAYGPQPRPIGKSHDPVGGRARPCAMRRPGTPWAELPAWATRSASQVSPAGRPRRR